MSTPFPPPLPRLGLAGKTLLTGALSLSYALVNRLAFATEFFKQFDGVVSLSFIFLTPYVMGALCVFLGYRIDRKSPYWLVVVPILATILGLAGSMLTRLEAMVCVVMASPIMLTMSLLGALSVHFLLKWTDRSRMQVSFFVLLPYVCAPLETLWQQPHEEVSITNSVIINAPPEIIWGQIASVAAISGKELPRQPIYYLGFPKPIAATLDREEVGGKRLATFERNVSFFEEITVWDKPRKLSFTIHADPDFIPHTAFDQHIIVGGRFYNVLDGTYEIIPGGTACRLVLTSRHRLSTRFNAYAGWWSEWIMGQIQGSILQVIRSRCENRLIQSGDSPSL